MHTHEYPILTLAPLLFTHAADVFQESAYVDALSIAAIAHTVAKACSEDLLKSCSCDEDAIDLPSADETNSVQYEEGCSDNADYGLHIAERFLNKRFTSVGRDLKHELAQHNYRAAKEVCVCITSLEKNERNILIMCINGAFPCTTKQNTA